MPFAKVFYEIQRGCWNIHQPGAGAHEVSLLELLRLGRDKTRSRRSFRDCFAELPQSAGKNGREVRIRRMWHAATFPLS